MNRPSRDWSASCHRVATRAYLIVVAAALEAVRVGAVAEYVRGELMRQGGAIGRLRPGMTVGHDTERISAEIRRIHEITELLPGEVGVDRAGGRGQLLDKDLLTSGPVLAVAGNAGTDRQGSCIRE